MKAVVFHGVGDIRLDEVPDPGLRERTDPIVRLTASAICGTDLHFVRGTFPGVKPGTILGHEGVGIVEEVGRGVRTLKRGDRVVIPSTVGCGNDVSPPVLRTGPRLHRCHGGGAATIELAARAGPDGEE